MSPNTSLDFLIYSDRYIKISPRDKEVFIRDVIFFSFSGRGRGLMAAVHQSRAFRGDDQDDARASSREQVLPTASSSDRIYGLLDSTQESIKLTYVRKTFSGFLAI